MKTLTTERMLHFHQRKLASTMIANLLEDLQHEEKITQEAKEELYQRYATDFGLTDLLPRRLKLTTDIAGAIMSKGMILEKIAGKAIAPEIVSVIPTVYPESMGYALMMDDAGKTKLYVGRGLATSQLEEYLGVLEDSNVIFSFGDSIAKNENEHQPYVLIQNDKGGPELVAFVEGDYPDYHETDGSHDTTNFIKNYLIPKVDELAELLDNDLDKMASALQKPTTVNDIKSKCTGRGVVTLMFSNGVSFTIEENDKRKSFDWGEVSISEGAYPVESDVDLPLDKPDVTIIPSGNPLQDRLNAQKAKAAAGKPSGVHDTTATKGALAKKDPAAAATTLNGGATSVPAISQKIFVFPPDKACKNKSDLNNWYMKGWGFLPPGHEVGIDTPDRAIPMPLDSLKTHVQKDARYQIRGTLASRGRSSKDTLPSAEVTKAALPVAKGTTAGGFPVIPSGQKEVVTGYLKTIDLKSQDISDPKYLDEIEKKASMFFDQYPDIDPTQFIIGCPIERLEELYLKWPESFKLLAYTLRHYAAIHVMGMKKLKNKEETVHELAKDELKPTGNALQDRLNAQKAKAAGKAA